MIAIQENLNALGGILEQYQMLSNKSWDDVIAKQGGKLAFAISRRLKGLTPGKGQITAENIARLQKTRGLRKSERAGLGVLVSPSVRRRVYAKYGARTRISDRRTVFLKGRRGMGKGSTVRKGKRLNLQALAVKEELRSRELGRGFLSVAGRFPRTLPASSVSMSRFAQLLGTAAIQLKRDDKGLRFEWNPAYSPQASHAAEGLSEAQSEQAILLGIRDTILDIMLYTKRKQDEAARRAFRRTIRIAKAFL